MYCRTTQLLTGICLQLGPDSCLAAEQKQQEFFERRIRPLLIEEYIHEQIVTNPGRTDRDFDPDNQLYKYP